MLGTILKSAVLELTAVFGRHHWPSFNHRLLILTYHRVLPDDHPHLRFEQPGMYVHPTTLESHISWLKQADFELVSLSQWLSNRDGGLPLPKKACAITIDDGWRDNVEYALPILKRYQVPATIFVVSRLVGAKIDFWPGRLASLLVHLSESHPEQWKNDCFKDIRGLAADFDFDKRAKIGPLEIDAAINRAKLFTDKQVNSMVAKAEECCDFPLEPQRTIINSFELLELAECELIDIGSHTCDHIRLKSDLPNEVIVEQVVVSKHELQKMTNRVICLFCYPNGDVSRVAIESVKECYIGACTTVSGWNNQKSNVFQLQRINIHEDNTCTRKKFLARIGRL